MPRTNRHAYLGNTIEKLQLSLKYPLQNNKVILDNNSTYMEGLSHIGNTSTTTTSGSKSTSANTLLYISQNTALKCQTEHMTISEFSKLKCLNDIPSLKSTADKTHSVT